MLDELNHGAIGRRDLLTAAGVTALAATATGVGAAAARAGDAAPAGASKANVTADTVTTRDGVKLYYKDWGPRNGPVVTLSHGWPLSSDSWDNQSFFLASQGFRVVAHDRRGHGRSSQPWDGNDMDHYADDLAAVIEGLDLRDISMFGFSTGGGEVARYIGRHGTERIARIGLISAVLPMMVRAADNPGGIPREIFDGFRAEMLENRAKFFREIPGGPFYGFNRPGATLDEGMVLAWYNQGMQGGFRNLFESIRAFSETDFRPDINRFDKPTLIIHGSEDQMVPLDAGGRATSQLLPHATLKIYDAAPHGLTETHKQKLNHDLLAFLKQ